jgi:hypothetical protein
MEKELFATITASGYSGAIVEKEKKSKQRTPARFKKREYNKGRTP